MKKTLFALMLLWAATANTSLMAQSPATGQVRESHIKWEYARMIALESVMAGGTGRSRLYVNHPDGKIEEESLSNYYSLTGINFGNVVENEVKKTKMLNKLAEQNWEVYWVETGSQEGIYVTKYLLRRPKN